ncbi:MAG TPA: molybdenum cofactor biosynthesis protein MoaB [Methanothermobacter sp.]|uniref:Molybdenum cofactor biosynthesis protein n=1 Tax=Methanothermobacter tenebrarum TaxID=680118 RepID=A0ABN6PFX1_9EURY|nr:molybdenum cofactor biosynthesis protein B [Methanothermobacter tenebrarum]MDD3455205.1 molybdenum cofactor biosynthesis protein MoaB [Methanobacteriales archaeon]MDI6881540.1 molybdenum cofactor biosynthesis protein B [Methanothermobacter sp.]MDX9693048.1 molybdenum cofactor biosynthesis protein B [Methanothermobacter sp.]BDH79817.1 molybdenum cofactor biosynthesis protein [Methanothermobacter tenebrarum]HHW16722.1 molybdenum cofactor biosynthesis protein MoaB [Methanothermobacter sp.]
MKSKTMEEHKKTAPSMIRCAIITLSDSQSREYGTVERPPSTDTSGQLLYENLKEKYQLIGYKLIGDDPKSLISAVNEMIRKGAMVIFTTGGTGIGKRDITIETLRGLFEKELEGFGEIFRYESYRELGAGAILTRATAGIYKDSLIIALPGSPNAVKMGLNIILDELGHIIKHVMEHTKNR